MTALREQNNAIGWVSSIESERISIELDPSVIGMVKAGPSGVLPLGSINSYVTLAAGPHRLLAVITGLKVAEQQPSGRGEYGLPAAIRRELSATMIGRIEGSEFFSGLTNYPSLFAPVEVATRADLETIFRPSKGPSIRLGEAVVAPDQDVYLDANVLLARHSAVVGSTGSGKSCTLTAIIDGLLELDVPYSNIIIFDSNGEYSKCFQPGSERTKKANPFLIGPEPGAKSGLVVPHWFMNNEEHLSLLRASELAQAPLLQRAIADARLREGVESDLLSNVRIMSRVIGTIREIDQSGSRTPQPPLAGQFSSLESEISSLRKSAEEANQDEAASIWTGIGEFVAKWKDLDLVTDPKKAWDVHLTAEQRELFDAIVRGIEKKLDDAIDALGLGASVASADFDAPVHYSLEELYRTYLPDRIELESINEPRIVNYAATLLMRLSRLLADARYNFLTRVPEFDESLAAYLGHVLGYAGVASEASSAPPWELPPSDASKDALRHSVTVIDLSLIAADVLENVTALLARLIMDFAQRVDPRSSFPMLLVLEEAHRYIPNTSGGKDSRAAATFERIAKEGRKFGVSLMLASQRPGELSTTVVSQCGTLIAHRVVNELDQNLIRHATPLAGRDVLRQLPGLARQHAVVLGEAVSAPALARIAHVVDPPFSSDPDYIARWRSGPDAEPGSVIRQVAAKWQSSVESDGGTSL